MQFLKWMTPSKNKELRQKIDDLERQNEILLEQFTRQNETLQEVVVCIRRLAETDEAIYKDIMAIATVISGEPSAEFNEEFIFKFREKEKDEYLN